MFLPMLKLQTEILERYYEYKCSYEKNARKENIRKLIKEK